MISSTIITVIVFTVILALYFIISSKRIKYVYGYEIFNPISYNFSIYLLTGLIGCIALIVLPISEDVNNMIDSYATFELRLKVLLIMLYGCVIFIISILLLRVLPWINIAFTKSDKNIYDKTISIKPLTCIIITTSLLAIILYYTSYRIYPFALVLLQGFDALNILAIRSNLVEIENKGYFLRRLIVEGFAWIFVLYLARSNKYRIQYILLVSALAVFFLVSLTKIKLIMFILSILMIKSWNKRFNIVAILRIGILIFIGLIGMWSLFIRNFDLGYLFSIYSEGLVGRILISEISSLYAHLTIFGNYEDYIGFSSLSNVFSYIFDINSSPRSGRIVLETVSPVWVSSGIGGVYNTVFFGEAYANFGYIGLLLSPLWIILCYILIIYGGIFILPQLRLAFLIYITLNLNVMSGFNDFLWNPFLIILFIVLLLISHYKTFIHTSIIFEKS